MGHVSPALPCFVPYLISLMLSAEIVLATLLSEFRFELTETPVVWKSAAVDYPTMGKESTKPQLLLKVTLL